MARGTSPSGPRASCSDASGASSWPSVLRDLLLIWNNNFTAGAGHGGKRTPLTAAISSDEGKTWQNVRNLEADPARGYAYTSLTFVGGRAVLTYYEDDPEAQRFSTWFRSLPVTWFYAGE